MSADQKPSRVIDRGLESEPVAHLRKAASIWEAFCFEEEETGRQPLEGHFRVEK